MSIRWTCRVHTEEWLIVYNTVQHTENFVFSRSIHLQGIQHRVFLHCATCRIFFFPACTIHSMASMQFILFLQCTVQHVDCSVVCFPEYRMQCTVLCCYRVQHPEYCVFPACTRQSFFVFAFCSKQWVPFAKHAAFLVYCTSFSFLPAKGIPSIQFYLHFSKQREEKIRLERGKLN